MTTLRERIREINNGSNSAGETLLGLADMLDENPEYWVRRTMYRDELGNDHWSLTHLHQYEPVSACVLGIVRMAWPDRDWKSDDFRTREEIHVALGRTAEPSGEPEGIRLVMNHNDRVISDAGEAAEWFRRAATHLPRQE